MTDSPAPRIRTGIQTSGIQGTWVQQQVAQCCGGIQGLDQHGEETESSVCYQGSGEPVLGPHQAGNEVETPPATDFLPGKQRGETAAT